MAEYKNIDAINQIFDELMAREIKAIANTKSDLGYERHWGKFDTIEEIKYRIEKLPAADVAPVVRCDECIHQENCMHQIVFWERDNVLEQNTSQYHKLDFCSYGERRSE